MCKYRQSDVGARTGEARGDFYSYGAWCRQGESRTANANGECSTGLCRRHGRRAAGVCGHEAVVGTDVFACDRDADRCGAVVAGAWICVWLVDGDGVDLWRGAGMDQFKGATSECDAGYESFDSGRVVFVTAVARNPAGGFVCCVIDWRRIVGQEPEQAAASKLRSGDG